MIADGIIGKASDEKGQRFLDTMTTKTTGHTPGPWHTSQRTGDETSVRSLDGSIVAECNTLADRGQELANARLITAAPAMLAALQCIVDAYGEACECIDDTKHCPYCIARAAITAATK